MIQLGFTGSVGRWQILRHSHTSSRPGSAAFAVSRLSRRQILNAHFVQRPRQLSRFDAADVERGVPDRAAPRAPFDATQRSFCSAPNSPKPPVEKKIVIADDDV